MSLTLQSALSAWPESRLLADPVKPKHLTVPRVLVKRNADLVMGARQEEIIQLPGPPAVSLFTGAGGMDLGLEAAGFCVVLQHEMDQTCCETLIANRPRFRYAALIQGDIRKTPTSMILAEANLRVGEARLLTGGPPCQGFSAGNKHSFRGRYDTRNDLVFEFLRVVDEAQPHFFLFENVPGFVRFNKHQYLKAFLRSAYGAYYELVYALVDAVEYGVPQYRCRFICMGTRRDLFEIEGCLGAMPTAETFSHRDLRIIRTDFLQGQRLKRTPGIRYFPGRPVLIPPAPIQHGKEGGRSKGYLDFWDRLQREEPDRVVLEPLDSEAAA